MSEVPHTCCNVREGVFWICPDCHLGPKPKELGGMIFFEILCDIHLKESLLNAPYRFDRWEPK